MLAGVLNSIRDVFLTFQGVTIKKYNGLTALLKFGIDLLKYPTKPNVLRNSVIILVGALICDLTAAIFLGSAV